MGEYDTPQATTDIINLMELFGELSCCLLGPWEGGRRDGRMMGCDGVRCRMRCVSGVCWVYRRTGRTGGGPGA